MKAINLTNLRFGRWLVIAPGQKRGRRTTWTCRCDCGFSKDVVTDQLTGGKSQSCGCLQRELFAKKKTIHGGSRRSGKKPEYTVWTEMVKRYTNPHGDQYADYGGRGITVCQQWRESFAAFMEDMGPRPSKHHSIDRIDNNDGYRAGNCRWATSTQQARNRRNVKMFNIDGEKLTIPEIAEKFNIASGTLWQRLQSGVTIEIAISSLTGWHYRRLAERVGAA